MKGVTFQLIQFDYLAFISTHTPVKGVTIPAVFNGFTLCISTHTPVKGVTVFAPVLDVARPNFNSHAREGRDKFFNA